MPRVKYDHPQPPGKDITQQLSTRRLLLQLCTAAWGQDSLRSHAGCHPVTMLQLVWPLQVCASAGRQEEESQAQYGPATCGQYDPILHTWIAPPDEKAWRERERQHQHEAGCTLPLAAEHACMGFRKCSRHLGAVQTTFVYVLHCCDRLALTQWGLGQLLLSLPSIGRCCSGAVLLGCKATSTQSN